MAIINKKVKPLKNDRDENVFIGIDLPFRKSDGNSGWFESTSTTFKAVRNNIKSLLLTEKGQRIMQPSLGLNLKKYLFEQMTDDLIISIENDIQQTFSFWLPFVLIQNIEIKTNIEDVSVSTNTISINIIFSIFYYSFIDSFYS